MFKYISPSYEYFNIYKNNFLTSSVFDENTTKSWEDEMKYVKQTRESSSLKKSILIENGQTATLLLVDHSSVKLDPQFR